MSFTNDDLKSLKERAKNHNFAVNSLMNRQHFEALLLRMEAAERVAEHFKPKLNRMCEECKVSLEAWRKSCGEVGE